MDGDIDALAQIDAAELNGDQLGRTKLEGFISESCVLIAELDDVLVGFCVVRRRPERSMAILDAIAITSAFTGRGYGKALLGAAVLEAYRHGFSSMQLHVRADNPIAITFYQNFGFRRLRRLRREPEIYLDGTMAVRMRKRLRSQNRLFQAFSGVIRLLKSR
ncbi:GNAT family N-acetyltransferase [Mesorhizobium sp.]|uniref:GNAT family N-acetyltransferase n=1 Tax=Mesorhizobium sp. TaxID=1871066 RepID=UPI0025BD4B95|nr:GNAT family N-acetyltransferase [Mesorhizobium sp.]